MNRKNRMWYAADVAAEREIAERAGNQQQPAAPKDKKDQQHD